MSPPEPSQPYSAEIGIAESCTPSVEELPAFVVLP
jgi:hypothetical protein